MKSCHPEAKPKDLARIIFSSCHPEAKPKDLARIIFSSCHPEAKPKDLLGINHLYGAEALSDQNYARKILRFALGDGKITVDKSMIILSVIFKDSKRKLNQGVRRFQDSLVVRQNYL